MIRVPERVRPCVPCMSRVCPGSPQASKLLFACLRKGQLNRHTWYRKALRGESLLAKGSVESLGSLRCLFTGLYAAGIFVSKISYRAWRVGVSPFLVAKT